MPRRLEDELGAYFQAQGRYPSGFPRSRGALAPFFRIPPYLAFNRTPGIQPSPFGNPPRTAAQPLRFGLFPLELGLGLSPAVSALLNRGVPTARRAAAPGGPADVATLVGRGQPQDIAAIVRLEQLGLIPPGTSAALLQGQRGGGPAVLPPPAAARRLVEAEEPAGVQAFSAARKALGAAKEIEQFSRGEGTAHEILTELGVLPPGSAARDPAVEEAFQLQRAGERQPAAQAALAGMDPASVDALLKGAAFAAQEAATGIPAFGRGATLGAGTILPGAAEAGGILAPSAASLAQAAQAIPGAFSLTQPISDIAALAGEAGISGLGAGGASLASQFGAANEAALAGLEGLGGGLGEAAAGTFSGLGGILKGLGGLGSLAGIGLSAAQGDPIGAGLGGAGLLASFALPPPFNIIAAAGIPILGGLFRSLFGGGGHTKGSSVMLPGFAAPVQTRTAGGTQTLYKSYQEGLAGLGPLGADVSGAKTLSELADALKRNSQRTGGGSYGTYSLWLSPAGERMRVNPSDFTPELLMDPLVRAGLRVQAGAQGAPAAQPAATRGILAKLQELAPLPGGPLGVSLEDVIAGQEGWKGPPGVSYAGLVPIAARLPGDLATFYGVAPAAPEGPPPSAPPPPIPPEEPAAPPPPSLQAGGPVPATGPYRLHAGELVIPKDVAEALRRGLIQAEQVMPPGGAPEAFARFRSLVPEIESELDEDTDAEEPWYIASNPKHAGGGVPFQSKANPDPSNVWRLATSARDLREALDEGDPVIAVAPQTLAGARRGTPEALLAIEAARMAQYERPDVGIETLDAMGRASRSALAGVP